MIEPRRYFIDNRIRLAEVATELMRYPVEAERPLEVIVRTPRKEKTPEQRRLFHAICGDIGGTLGLTPGEVKSAIKQDFFGVDKVKIGGRVYDVVQSSEDSEREEYGRLIDYAYIWAADREVKVADRRSK